jgi:hypothetical protein
MREHPRYYNASERDALIKEAANRLMGGAK